MLTEALNSIEWTKWNSKFNKTVKSAINTLSLSIFLALSSPITNAWTSDNEQSKTIQFVHTDNETWEITKLSDYKWKWVIVNFWAPWCPICIQEFPDLMNIDKKEDVVVISVAMDYWPSKDGAKDTIRRNNLSFEKIIFWLSRRDENSFSRQVWPVDFYPTTYLYDKNWNLVAYMPWKFNLWKVENFIKWNKQKK